MRLFKRRERFDATTEVSASARVSHDTVLGRYCYVGNYSDITKAKIGNYVSIGNNVSIGPGEHALTNISTSSLFYADPYADLTRDNCVIGSDTWIGVDAIVRRGVKTGIGSVIGANSFVNKDIPDFAIVAGSPATIRGYRFSPEQQDAILASRWWELDLVEARQVVDNLRKQIEL